MPGYFYIVADKAGKEKRGKMEANNRDAAKELLKKDGYVILSLEEQSQQFDMNFTFGRKLKPRDLSVVRQHFRVRCRHERSTCNVRGTDGK